MGRRLRLVVAALLLFLLLVSVSFLHHHFWNFYAGSWNDFKGWYPDFYFIVFPLAKLLPFVAAAIFIWFARKQLRNFISFIRSAASGNAKNLLLAFAFVCFALVVAEFVLRTSGYKPGYRVYSKYFHPVDSLFLLDGFTADSAGIVTVAPRSREYICEELKRKNCTYELNPIIESQSDEVYRLPEHYVTFHGYNYKSPLKAYVREISESLDTSDKEFIDAVLNYTHCPVNADGFKSIEFKKYGTKRKGILLIGDSFTWGHSASNFTNCFADLLLARGYMVYNTGIIATDPTQYVAVAKKFVPLLKPDYVVVNFYIGNDVMFFNREPRPLKPSFYCTNAGNLIACPQGVYFESAKEAYDYTLAHFTIPENDNWFNGLCSKTVLSTMVWNVITEWKPEWTMKRYKDYYRKVNEANIGKPYSDIQLQEIRQLAIQAGVNFILVAIPQHDGKKLIFPEGYPEILKDLEYQVPPVNINHYENRNDGHYNDSGHAIHAAFIDSLIQNHSSRNN